MISKISLFFRALKDLLNLALIFGDEKKKFFHGNLNLIRNKKYNYLYRKCYSNGVDLLFYSSQNEIFFFKTKDNIYVQTDEHYAVFIEVFIEQIYSLPPIFLQNEFYVFDIGMNRGYASLYFAKIPTCRGVYGFELMEDTYQKALRNFEMNKTISTKISPYNFGLFDKDEELELLLATEKDYIISTEFNQDKNKDTHKNEQQGNLSTTKVQVKKSSTVLKDILNTLPSTRYKIIKIDVEGAEYPIFKDLKESNVINEFDFIIGECHKKIEDLEKYLDDFLPVRISSDTNSFISFAYIHKKHKNLL